MAHRKLQQEIDRVFKKINEGLEIFDTLYERHGSSQNASQKEKLESDLKKEIKKLQRFREQIKNWQSTNEVKDKEKLVEHRRLVEVAMEQYKTVEKNAKTKAYSDQALMNLRPKELDPDEKERYETVQFLNGCLSELERQMEALEAEIDKLQSNKKGKKSSSFADGERKNEVMEFMARDKFHQEKWEQILRLVENDVLAPAQVTDIKDGIEYFLESNQDSEFYEDDTLYDELNLDENDLVNQVTVSLKEGSEEEDGESRKGSTVSPTPVATTPTKQRSVSGPAALQKPASPAPPLPAHAASISAKAQDHLEEKRSVTPHSAAIPLASNPVATTLKPAPVRTKTKAEMSWSAAIASAAGPNAVTAETEQVSTEARALSPGSNTVAASAENTRSTSPDNEQRQNLVEQVIPLSDFTTGTETPHENNKQQATLSATIKSATLAMTDSSTTEQDSKIANDEDLLVLPPGLQDIITSFVTVRKGPNPRPAKPIDSCATLLKGYRSYYPLPERVIPNPEDAQKAYNTWMFVKGSGNAKELLNRVDPATLFFVYYYSLLPLEKKAAAEALFSKGWRLHKSECYWLQRLGEPMVFPAYEQGHFRVFDATKWNVQEHPGFQFVYNDYIPQPNPENGTHI